MKIKYIVPSYRRAKSMTTLDYLSEAVVVVSEDEIEEYKKKDNVLFVSEDFVVFTDKIGNGEESFVLLPFPIEEIEANVPGTSNVIGTSPTMSSDTELKRSFHKPMVKGMYTMIVAFDE